MVGLWVAIGVLVLFLIISATCLHSAEKECREWRAKYYEYREHVRKNTVSKQSYREIWSIAVANGVNLDAELQKRAEKVVNDFLAMP